MECGFREWVERVGAGKMRGVACSRWMGWRLNAKILEGIAASLSTNSAPGSQGEFCFPVHFFEEQARPSSRAGQTHEAVAGAEKGQEACPLAKPQSKKIPCFPLPFLTESVELNVAASILALRSIYHALWLFIVAEKLNLTP